MAFSANETRPGDSISVTVRAAKGSCVCLATVDKSIYLFKPGFQLTTDQVSSIHLGGGIVWCYQTAESKKEVMTF